MSRIKTVPVFQLIGKNLKKGPVFKSPKFPTFSRNLENSTESRKNLVIWLKYTFVNNVQAGTYRHLKLEIKAALAQCFGLFIRTI